MLNRFVTSESKLFTKMLQYRLDHIIPIIDYAVEHDKNKYSFEHKYKQILHSHPNNYHAIKLTGLDLSSIITNNISDYASFTNNKLLIDAEDVRVQDRINTLTNKLILNNDTHIFKTYQMYRKDSIELLLNDIEYFNNKGLTLNIKLVRGAYLNQDKYTGALFDKKEDTDKAYNYAIDIIKSNQNQLGEVIYATHNKKSFDKVKDLDDDKSFHACLMGFDEPLTWQGNIKKMVYIPFGPIHKTYPYLIRRLIENPFMFKAN